MHLGRFHHAIYLLRNDFQETKVVELIKELIGSLNAISGNPGNADIAKNFKNILDRCSKVLSESNLNSPRPILRSLLQSIDAEKYIGSALFARIKQAIDNNHVAPALAVQELTAVQQDVEQFYKQVLAIDAAFSKLDVEYDYLDAGDSEIGLLIPRKDGESSLKDLSREANQWQNALSPIVELFDSDLPPLQIKTFATTDWMFYLAATPPVLFGVSYCIKGINAILKETIEAKSLIAQLAKKNTREELIAQLEADNGSKLENDLRTFSDGIVDEHYKGGNNERKNELKNALSISIKTIANKLAAGTKIEVQLIPPPKPKAPEGEEEPVSPEISALQDEITKLEELSEQLDREAELLEFSDDYAVLQSLLAYREDPASPDEQT